MHIFRNGVHACKELLTASIKKICMCCFFKGQSIEYSIRRANSDRSDKVTINHSFGLLRIEELKTIILKSLQNIQNKFSTLHLLKSLKIRHFLAKI